MAALVPWEVDSLAPMDLLLLKKTAITFIQTLRKVKNYLCEMLMIWDVHPAKVKNIKKRKE